MRETVLLLTTLVGSGLFAATEIPAPAVQIAAAVLAAPEDLREGAAVLGYNAQRELVKLREGKNELVCLASDPAKSAFHVACYHKELEPYMERGRELLAQKITGKQRNDIRWKELADGKIPTVREPRILYVLDGSSYDPASGEVKDPYRRWVLYWPYATGESTGLSTKPIPGGPWLMDAGTAGAHIMINPPRKK